MKAAVERALQGVGEVAFYVPAPLRKQFLTNVFKALRNRQGHWVKGHFGALKLVGRDGCLHAAQHMAADEDD